MRKTSLLATARTLHQPFCPELGLSMKKSEFAHLPLIYLITQEMGCLQRVSFPQKNPLRCIKESSGHRLCPQTRFRSPEKSTQRDSFRLQYTYVSVSAFAFGCMCLCVLACFLSAGVCVCECACICLCGCVFLL